jgi:acetate kinase
MRILVVNAGSSSLKLRLLDHGDEVLGTVDLPADERGFDAGALTAALADWPTPDVVGHRVVHGGTEFSSAVVVDEDVAIRLRALTDLAPLHQPKSLAGLDAVTDALPDVRAVACFDTAFHQTIAPAASTYAVPAEWRERYGVRRYGFHGLSHAYASRRGHDLAGRTASRVVTCHLGAGASLCAVLDGRSVDTTMGFTPLEGLVMATRSGSVDPGLLLWLQQSAGIGLDELADALEHRSGLLALAGTGDMRQVLEDADRDKPDAVLAIDVYVHRLRGAIAAMAAALGGVDALAFTGGVGEGAAQIRRLTADGLGFLGVGVDADANRDAAPDADVSGPGAAVRTLVIAAREDLQIAAGVRQVLAGREARPTTLSGASLANAATPPATSATNTAMPR